MNNVRTGLFIGCWLVGISVQAAVVISVNLADNSGDKTLAANDAAGVVSVPNWNNLVGNASGDSWNSGSIANMVDHQGNATGASLNYSTVGGNHGLFTNGDIATPYATPSHAMMGNFLHAFGSSRYAVFSVNNLPSSVTQHGYNFYLYISGGGATADRVGHYMLDLGSNGGYGNHDLEIFAFENGNTYAGTFVNAGSSTTAAGAGQGNFIVFSNLTASSFTLYANGDDFANSGHNRAAINGFQIQGLSIPEPGTMALMLMALGLISALRRQRLQA